MHYMTKTYLLGSALSLSHAVFAEVVLDGTLGPSGALPGPEFAIEAKLGQQMGNNLFHSFERFNLNQQESATFSGPNEVQNIIGRVTGGSPSTIDGTIRSEIPNADLYFLNPAGILFGQNAQLNVQGSFYSSTADYLRLGEDGRFEARYPQNSLLTVAPPSAFGFLDAPSAGIEKKGFLAVPNGKTLALVGGDLMLQDNELTGRNQAVMSAPGGQVYLISVASAGEVPVEPANLSDNAFEQLGIINMTDVPIIQTRNIDVSDGGKVYIQAGQILMENVSISSYNMQGEKNGQDIMIKATDKITLKGTANISAMVFAGTSNGGNIDIIAKEINLIDGSQMTVGSAGSGMSGHITLKASDKILIAGFSQEGQGSGLSAQTYGTGGGNMITVAAPTVILENGSVIQANSTGQGDAGDILLQVDTLTLKKGAQVNVNSGGRFSPVGGRGGTLTVTAKKAILITGQLSEDHESALVSNTFTPSEGGSIIVSAPLLEIPDNGTIQAATQFDGKAGQISLNVDTLLIGQEGSITTETLGEGLGGSIEIQAREINLTGKIKADSSGQGNAGSIQITTDTLHMNNAAITTDTQGADGGHITISSPSYLYLRDGSNITASTTEDGHGGNITLKPEFIILDNSRIKADAVEGKGGNITITATSIYHTEQDAIKHYRPEKLTPAAELITARSQSQLAGMEGVVEIDISDVNVAESLTTLPLVLKADDLLPTPCGQQLAENVSVFTKVYSQGMSYAYEDLLPSGLMSFEPITLKTPIARKSKGEKKRSPLLMGRLTECSPLRLSMSTWLKTPTQLGKFQIHQKNQMIPPQLF